MTGEEYNGLLVPTEAAISMNLSHKNLISTYKIVVEDPANTPDGPGALPSYILLTLELNLGHPSACTSLWSRTLPTRRWTRGVFPLYACSNILQIPIESTIKEPY